MSHVSNDSVTASQHAHVTICSPVPLCSHSLPSPALCITSPWSFLLFQLPRPATLLVHQMPSDFSTDLAITAVTSFPSPVHLAHPPLISLWSSFSDRYYDWSKTKDKFFLIYPLKKWSLGHNPTFYLRCRCLVHTHKLSEKCLLAFLGFWFSVCCVFILLFPSHLACTILVSPSLLPVFSLATQLLACSLSSHLFPIATLVQFVF